MTRRYARAFGKTESRIARRSDRMQLAELWRERAAAAEQLARLVREDGDHVYAAELETVALDYRLAADELEES